MLSVDKHPVRATPAVAAALVAVALPTLIAFNVPPSATLFNQAAALIGWGAFALTLTLTLSSVSARALLASHGLTALLAAMALLLIAALAAPTWAALPWPLALCNAGTILVAIFIIIVAVWTVKAGIGEAAFHAFCVALVVAGLASSAIGLIQVYAPQWTDGNWIAHTPSGGRAVGNVRQPNHLSSLLLWSIVAAVWLGEVRWLSRNVASAMALLFVFVLVLSASRTGALGTVTIAAWGLVDRRLSRQARVALLLAPIAYALIWLGAVEWAHASGQAFGGENRFSASGDVSSSRFAIWSNTLDLIRAHPWLGVGFGEFNFAWTLTPFPGRPREFFDHAHDLPLQFAAELGLPLTAVVLGLFGWALFKAVRIAVDAGQGSDEGSAPMQRASLVMVLLIAVHSLLEYPLWYAYFLFPTAFAFGLCLVRIRPVQSIEMETPMTSEMQAQADSARPMPTSTPALPQRTRPLVLASMALIFCGFLVLSDYLRVVVIFAPSGKTSLTERIDGGRHSWLFSQHADYAAATVAEHPSTALESFKSAPHYLLDARLMMAWAEALNEVGDTDRARYIAARLKEFGHEQAEAFFAVCDKAPEPGAKRPFQCEPPTRAYTFLDFR
jgi:O-antigen ligase